MNTIFIESYRIKNFKSEFEKFAAKVCKMGFAKPEYTIGDLIQKQRNLYTEDEGVKSYIIDVFPVSFNLQDSYKLNGWNLYSTIRFDYGIVIPVNVESNTPDGLGLQYYKCDHCGGNHGKRKISFIVEKNGTFKQVGSTCIHEFLGVSPNLILKFAAKLDVLVKEFEFDETDSIGGNRNQYDLTKLEAIELSPIYDAAYQVLKESKYVKKTHFTDIYGRVDYNIRTNQGEATIDKVEELLESGNVNVNVPDDFFTYLESLVYEQVDPEKGSLINDIIDIRENQRIRRNQIHLPILAVVNYLKSIEVCQSNHQGVIGEKVNVEATITDVKTGESDFGSWTLYIMVDDNGNIYKKFGSIRNDLYMNDEKTRVRFTADVKNHEVFNNQNITVLGRLSKIKK